MVGFFSVERGSMGAYDGTCNIRSGVVDVQSFLYKNYGTSNEASRSQKTKREGPCL